MTAADRPSVTDNARAEAERRWPEWENDEYHEGHVNGLMALTGLDRAAGRAEATTATVEDAARVLYESGTGFKLTEGKPWEELTESSRNSQRRLAQALADAGLLASPSPARTRPTREQIAEAIHAVTCGFADCTYGWADEQAADAVLALLADQPDPADVWDQGYQAGADGGYLGDALADNPYRGGAR